MADDTDTTRPGEAAAVEAAAQAEYLDCYMGRPDVPWESLDPDLKRQLRDTVRGGIAVAYPIIAAAVREQAAQDIEREAEREKDHFPPRWPGDTFWEGVTSGKRRAAGIARDSR